MQHMEGDGEISAAFVGLWRGQSGEGGSPQAGQPQSFI